MANSVHFDGQRFFNPSGVHPARSIGELLRWKLGSRAARWPRRVANAEFAPPPDRVNPGEVAATFVGQATWVLRFAGAGVLTDPVWSERAGPGGRWGPRRVRGPGLAFGRLRGVEAVLVSHNHYDHLDRPTLRRLRRCGRPRFVTGLGNGRLMPGGGVELDWWQSVRLPSGVEVTMTPAQHYSARTPFDTNRTLWGGFFIRAAGVSVYFAGDTGYDAALFRSIRERLGPPDLALLPIGAYEPRWFMRAAHMNPEEPVQAFLDLGARWAVGMHFQTFPLADEPFEEPPVRLRAALAGRGIDAARFWVPGFGETRVFGGDGRAGSKKT